MRPAKRSHLARRPARFVAPLAVLASALASGPLFAGGNPGSVKGKLSGWDKLFPSVYADAAKPDSHRFTWREPSPTVKADFRKLTGSVSHDVCVAAFGTGQAPAHDPLKIIVSGGRTSATTIVLSPGSRLSFKNADPFPHVLYEQGNASWAPNPTAPGSSREWAATAAGLHVIRDQLFPSIAMYVFIDASAVEVAFPDREGTFSMNLPAGDYTLKTFFEGKPTGKPLDGVHVSDGKEVELKDPMALGGDAK
jgi:hypothetical protein